MPTQQTKLEWKNPNWNSGGMYGPVQQKKLFVLCFDGTGNKFSGTDADSNILKIYGMLDRSDPRQLHYYQPGIGTYVDSKSLSHTSIPARFNSWYQKAKDSAVGTSFDEHVMGGYKFLMRYYSAGDDIYFFGFSRGAYIARFLAEMLDYVGLLSAGNEEMARFAWKAFAHWQRRLDNTKEEKAKKKKMFQYLTGFRETFSRPVRRIRFLGLFDTVQSVPRFESAFLQRSRFPYTAKSSALVIRHAVAIDERRAKFRQDLLGEAKSESHNHHRDHRRPSMKIAHSGNHLTIPSKMTEPERDQGKNELQPSERFRRPSQAQMHHNRLNLEHARQRSASPARSLGAISENDKSSVRSGSSHMSSEPPRVPDVDDEDDEDVEQDIQEIWFPGCHADIGGGWTPSPGEEYLLSHGPLVWIVREALKAGLNLNYEKMKKFKCVDDEEEFEDLRPRNPTVPEVKVTQESNGDAQSPVRQTQASEFRHVLHTAATRGIIHDCLEFGKGLSLGSVLAWNVMEYLPFRRMDLQPDGSWKPIRWPLPRGEIRDIPSEAWIHTSALRRMEINEDYRPGNLIIGGGGRGVKVAPKKYGMGNWEIIGEEGDPVGEVMVRKKEATMESKG